MACNTLKMMKRIKVSDLVPAFQIAKNPHQLTWAPCISGKTPDKIAQFIINRKAVFISHQKASVNHLLAFIHHIFYRRKSLRVL